MGMSSVDLATLEYPRHLHGRAGAFRVVRSPEEAAAELANGWSLIPVLDIHDPPPIEPDPAPAPKKARRR